MTDTAEIIARAILTKQGIDPEDEQRCDDTAWLIAQQITEGVIAALTEAGIMLLTKQEAIDYVLDLPADELGETQTRPAKPNTAGRRLRELQKAMIGAGK